MSFSAGHMLLLSYYYAVITVGILKLLTAPLDVDAEGGLHLANVIVNVDVHAVDARSGEVVVETQYVLVQHGQRTARRLGRHAVKTETPANPHGRTEDRQLDD